MKISSTGFSNPYIVNKKVMQDIVFYTKNGIELSLDRGWFKVGTTDIKEILMDIDEIKNRRKVKFDNNEVFTCETTLYIPSRLVNLKYKGEELKYTTDTEDVYFDNFTCDIPYHKHGRICFDMKLEKYSHRVTHDKGTKLNELHKKFEEDRLGVDKYILANILEKYDIIKKVVV
jgi:hypothetical protein